MRFLLFLCLVIYTGTFAGAQDRYNANWVIGSDNYIGMTDGVVLMFNNTGFAIDTFHAILELSTQSSVISDKNGNLLFYSDGCRIANADHEIMAGGDSINYPGLTFQLDCISGGGYYLFQGLVALPYPGQDGLYVMFHLHCPSTTIRVQPEQIMYSLIDMRAEGGKGRVIAKNQVLASSEYIDALTAVKHGNGRDWWVVAPLSDGSDKYHLFLLTPEGVSGPFVRQGGFIKMFNRGQAVFSPDGTKYARTQGDGTAVIMKFDRCSGQFYCPRLLRFLKKDSFASGAAFSPDSRFLYISVPEFLYQYDTETDNPLEQPVLIDEYDGFWNPFPTRFHRQMLAPDGKIYMSSTNGAKNLHVIESPNEPGAACNFRQHGIDLPASGFFNIPNFPYFQLYDLPRSVCDTLGIDAPAGVEVTTWTPPAGVTVQPNPVRDQAYIALASCAFGDLRIFDAAGRLMYQQNGWQGPASLLVDVGNWPSGVYFINVYYDKRYRFNTKMVVLH